MSTAGPLDFSTAELRSFLEIIKHGTITHAARHLGITQPTLSWTIRRLEERLGSDLFIRSKQGVSLTRNGKMLAAHSRALLRAFEQLETDLRADQETVRGMYSIGVYPTLATHTLPRFLPKLLEDWPDLHITIGHDSSQNISRGIVELRYDLGIVVNPPSHPDLTIIDLYSDEVGLWLAKEYPWKQRRRHVPIICHPDMPQVAPILDQMSKQELFSDFRLVHTTDLQVVSDLTAASCGYGILPTSVARNQKTTTLVPFGKSPVMRDQISLIWRSDAQKSKASKIIRDAIKTSLRKNETLAPKAKTKKKSDRKRSAQC